MKVTKFKSPKIVNWNLHNYKFDPDKKVSKDQKIIQDFLLKYISPNFIYQECRIPGSLKRFDLVIPSKKLIIEYSPESHHAEFNSFFHNNSRIKFLKVIKADIEKIQWAEKNEFKVLELTEKDIPLLSYDYLIENFDVYI